MKSTTFQYDSFYLRIALTDSFMPTTHNTNHRFGLAYVKSRMTIFQIFKIIQSLQIAVWQERERNIPSHVRSLTTKTNTRKKIPRHLQNYQHY